ncbi:MAG: MarR family transcriptional regulator [Pseudomonadota bacterium]
MRATDARLFLRDEELDRGAFLILAAERRLGAAIATAARALDLGRSEVDILLGIHATPGVTVTDLRERLGMTVPTFARLLGQLDRRGFVRKTPSGRDGRRRNLYVSQEALTVIDPVIAALREVLRPVYRESGGDVVSGAVDLLSAVAEPDNG